MEEFKKEEYREIDEFIKNMGEHLTFKPHKSNNQLKITIPKKLIKFFGLEEKNYIFLYVKNKKNIVIFEKLYKNNGSYVVNLSKEYKQIIGINIDNYREFDFYLKY